MGLHGAVFPVVPSAWLSFSPPAGSRATLGGNNFSYWDGGGGAPCTTRGDGVPFLGEHGSDAAGFRRGRGVAARRVVGRDACLLG